MIKNQWIWIGQRVSDGLLYSKAIPTLRTFFSCDNVAFNVNKTVTGYSLLDADSQNNLFTQHYKYLDIDKIIDKYADQIKAELKIGKKPLVYYISDESKNKLGCKNIQNGIVYSTQLDRLTQHNLMLDFNISTPKFVNPQNLDWNQLARELGLPLILQYDRTSSGSGTYLVDNAISYDKVVLANGKIPDIATQYIKDGVSASAHIFITENNVYVFNASTQIVEKTCDQTTQCYNFHYVGNDFGHYYIKFGYDNLALDFLQKVGMALKSIGITGLLGIDYLRTDKGIFFNEINFRLQNSTAILSFFQNNGEVIRCITEGNCNVGQAIIEGFQIYRDIDIENICSGYYTQDGKLLSDKIDDWDLFDNGNYLVFCDIGYINDGKSGLRIIGQGEILNMDGKIQTEKINRFIKGLKLYAKRNS